MGLQPQLKAGGEVFPKVIIDTRRVLCGQFCPLADLRGETLPDKEGAGAIILNQCPGLRAEIDKRLLDFLGNRPSRAALYC